MTGIGMNIIDRKGRYRPIKLHALDREARTLMRQAHDEGRHGDGTKDEVVAYWAESCADCAAIWRYEFQGEEQRL